MSVPSKQRRSADGEYFGALAEQIAAIHKASETIAEGLRRQSSKHYFGKLAEQIDLRKWNLPEGPDGGIHQRLYASVERIPINNAQTILDYFDIPNDDPGCWLRLSLALAKRHVPAFQFAKKVGRRQKWSETRNAIARIAVDRFIEEHPRNIKSAAALVAKQEPWNEKAVARFMKQHEKHKIKSAAALLAKQEQWKKFLADDRTPAGDQDRLLSCAKGDGG
jgi:hypothetical protein